MQKILHWIDSIRSPNLLSESMQLSELTVGFEFECFFRVDPERSGEEGWYESAKHVEKTLKSNGFNRIYEDDSIREGVAAHAVEVDIGVYKFTPSNLKKIYNRMKLLYDLGAHTNWTCGLHVHFGVSPELFKNDVTNFWFLYWFDKMRLYDKFATFEGVEQFHRQFASIENMQVMFDELDKRISQLDARQKRMSFSDEDERMSVAQEILQMAESVKGEKFNLARMHPQGTIEWRGLRGLLDRRSMKDFDDLKLIRAYLFKFVAQFAKSITTILSDTSLEIAGLSLSELRHWWGQSIKSQGKDWADKESSEAFKKIVDMLDIEGTEKDSGGYSKLERIKKARYKFAALVKKWPTLEDVLINSEEEFMGSAVFETDTLTISGIKIEGVNLEPNKSGYGLEFVACEFNSCIFEYGALGSGSKITIEDSDLNGCTIHAKDEDLDFAEDWDPSKHNSRRAKMKMMSRILETLNMKYSYMNNCTLLWRGRRYELD